jgi:hypothetical protein
MLQKGLIMTAAFEVLFCGSNVSKVVLSGKSAFTAYCRKAAVRPV